MLARFIKWLIGYKEPVEYDYESMIKEKGSQLRNELYELNRQFARADDERWERIQKRLDLFFERQKCGLCGQIAKSCEKSMSHPYEKE